MPLLSPNSKAHKVYTVLGAHKRSRLVMSQEARNSMVRCTSSVDSNQDYDRSADAEQPCHYAAQTQYQLAIRCRGMVKIAYISQLITSAQEVPSFEVGGCTRPGIPGFQRGLRNRSAQQPAYLMRSTFEIDLNVPGRVQCTHVAPAKRRCWIRRTGEAIVTQRLLCAG